MKPVILASQSPRREELLKLLIDEFAIAPSSFDESRVAARDPEAHARACALGKARATARARNGSGPALVLGADTIVVVDDRILGKPADADDARRMLNLLSNRTHQVIGGVALLDTADGTAYMAGAVSEVTMRTIAAAEAEAYIASGCPFDKAGAYAIQGGAGKFVTGFTGDYYNIVGLPLAVVRELLAAAGVAVKELPPQPAWENRPDRG